MSITATQIEAAASRWGLSDVFAGAHTEVESLAAYGNLLLHWNARVALTAIRDEAEVIERHLMEGVFAAVHHPGGSNVLDFGSGTGIPGIPIAICRGDVFVTLAEANRKKASFLQEVIRTVQSPASVHAERAETLPPASFDAVWMRAVEKSATMFPVAASLVAGDGALCLFGTSEPPDLSASGKWRWKSVPFPGANARVLHIGRRI
jgi:16S rRNA (guanine527-N7)-methyltransferase